MSVLRGKEQLTSELLNRQVFLAISNMSVALVFAYAASGHVSGFWLALWLVAQASIQLARAVMTPSLRARLAHGDDASGYLVASSALSGIVWGSIAGFLLQSPTEPLTVTIPIFLAGMVAAGTIALPATPMAFNAFVTCALLPYIATQFWQVTTNSQVHGVISIGFLIGIMIVGRQLHGMLARSVALSEANGNLASALEVARHDLEARVVRRESELEALLETVPAYVWIAEDRDARRVALSRYARQRLSEAGGDATLLTEGQSSSGAEQLDSNGIMKVPHPLALAIQGQTVEGRELCTKLPDGRASYQIVSAAPLRSDDGEIVGAVGAGIDITARRRAEEALRLSETRFRDFAQSASDWLWETDSEHRFLWLSDNVYERVGAQPQWYYGRTRFDLLAADTSEEIAAAHKKTLDAHEPFRDFEYCRQDPGDLRWLSVSGVPIFDEHGRFEGYRGVARDISERKAAEERSRYLAEHDPLTGLANRRLLNRELARLSNSADRTALGISMLLIDLDHFKRVNDCYGHHAGDMFLCQVAERLEEDVADAGTIARVGGDEFAVLLTGVSDGMQLRQRAQSLLAALSTPIQLESNLVYASVSIGGATLADANDDPETIIRHADRALYRAKHEGRRRICIYDEKLDRYIEERNALTAELAGAVDRQELRLHYQPQVDLSSGSLVGVEALLRWEHPRHGLLPPARFLEHAESSGMIGRIGNWVIEEACRQARVWRMQGPAPRIAINLSQTQLADPTTLATIDRCLAKYSLDVDAIELEITETVIMEALLQCGPDVMDGYAMRNLRLALDDFGTGYSSLSNLRHLPAATIKIDRSFVTGIGDPSSPAAEDSEALIDAIVGLGHTLGKYVLAEGVETERQRARLAALNCDSGQGFLFGHPAPAETLELAA